MWSGVDTQAAVPTHRHTYRLGDWSLWSSSGQSVEQRNLEAVRLDVLLLPDFSVACSSNSWANTDHQRASVCVLVCVCCERVKKRGSRGILVVEVGNRLCVGYKTIIRGYDLIVIYCNTHYPSRSLAQPSALRLPWCSGGCSDITSRWCCQQSGNMLWMEVLHYKVKRGLLLLSSWGPTCGCVCVYHVYLHAPYTQSKAHHRQSPPQKVHRCAAGYKQR